MLLHGLLYISGFTFLKMLFLLSVQLLVVPELHLHFDSEGLGQYSAEFLRCSQIELLCRYISQGIYGQPVILKLEVFLIYCLGNGHKGAVEHMYHVRDVQSDYLFIC